jgi:GNAT superfamily N-acetyltransferase
MSILVRAAAPADAPIIAHFNIAMAIETEALRLDEPTVFAGVQAGLADPNRALYFVAEISGVVVGCCMITHEWSDWRNGDIWWLQSVYVHRDHRRAGVFRALHAHVIGAARQAGVVRLRLYVERDNTAAKRVYASLGMTMTHYDVMEQAIG